MIRHKYNLSNFIEIVLKQSHLAMKKNEIPVGSIIFNPSTGELVSKAHNSEISHNDPTAHAEILCIRRACKKLNLKRLDGLELLTYLEPCDMCKEVIKSSRISQVYFLLKNNNPKRKTIFNPKFKLIDYNNENLLKIFFKQKRIKD
jgi:tRNA(adenine34) deaminase